MYLGRDVLHSDDHRFVPVQWRSWNPKLAATRERMRKQTRKRLMTASSTRCTSPFRPGQRAREGQDPGAIIDTIVSAFD